MMGRPARVRSTTGWCPVDDPPPTATSEAPSAFSPLRGCFGRLIPAPVRSVVRTRTVGTFADIHRYATDPTLWTE